MIMYMYAAAMDNTIAAVFQCLLYLCQKTFYAVFEVVSAC